MRTNLTAAIVTSILAITIAASANAAPIRSQVQGFDYTSPSLESIWARAEAHGR